MHTTSINYCIRCGAKLVSIEKFGKLRPGCPECGWIYFADPKVAAAVLVEKEYLVLLARRKIEPARGKWTLPVGFVDAGEDPKDAARRECQEETGLSVQIGELLDVIYGLEHPRGAHIVLFYRAEIIAGEIKPGDDVDEVAFYSRNNLPELAFSTTRKILQLNK
jgi:8-oxo-dGTP diphosphatase